MWGAAYIFGVCVFATIPWLGSAIPLTVTQLPGSGKVVPMLKVGLSITGRRIADTRHQ